MVKKILFFIILLFITINVNAASVHLPSPVVYYHENGTYHQTTASTSTWNGVPVYEGPTIGRISSAIDVTRVDYNFWNVNICSGKNSNIKGSVFGLYQLFSVYNATVEVRNDGVQMTCTTSIPEGSQLDFNCYSDKQIGNLSIYLSTIVNYPYNFMTGVSQNLTYECNVTNEAIVSQSIVNTQNIINNQNSNTNAIIGSVGASSQNIINNQNSNTNKITDEISSEEEPDTDDYLEGFSENMASDTPISDLITMPLTLLNAYVNGVSANCSPYNLGSLLGTNLVLPCINLQQRLGSNLWGVIDALVSIFMIYNIAMLFISAFEGFTSLRDDYEGLYQPKHADTGYQPKHGGGS